MHTDCSAYNFAKFVDGRSQDWSLHRGEQWNIKGVAFTLEVVNQTALRRRAWFDSLHSTGIVV